MTTAVAPTGAGPAADEVRQTPHGTQGHEEHVPVLVLHPRRRAVPRSSSRCRRSRRSTSRSPAGRCSTCSSSGSTTSSSSSRSRSSSQAFINTFIYGFVTSAAKVVLGLALALLLTGPILGRGYLRGVIFFPVLVSTIGVGLTFKALLDPFHGIVNNVLGFMNLPQPGWYTDPNLALLTVARGGRLEGRRHRDADLHGRDRRDPA